MRRFRDRYIVFILQRNRRIVMKKLITAATAFTVAFTLLTGCGGSSATTAQNTESDEG
jgi:hypothetical protein